MAAAAMLELLCYEMGNYHRTLMKIGTQTKQNMLIESKSHKSGSSRQKIAKIKCKERYRFKKATLYEREVIKKQKFFICRQKLPYLYNMWQGNRSLKATYYARKLISSFYACIKI
jgi:hypothetical protein